MSSVKRLEIRCEHCGEWFPSPIAFGDTKSFDTSKLIGNRVTCKHCGQWTECNKENMRLREEGDTGGFVGKDT